MFTPKPRWATVLMVAVIAVCMGIRVQPATAQEARVEVTGQTTAYPNGDDGDIQAGVPFPKKRFRGPAGTAKTLHVASNGMDSTTCGSEDRPCRSIGQAIDNASAGDDLVVGAGEYGSREIGSPPFAIVVNKELSITSEEGAAATVINVRDTGRWPVKIFASHVTFGRPGHGFTLSANSVAPFSGISVDEIASDVTVEGNIVTGFGRGIDVAGNDSAIKHNIATGNGEGLNIHGNRNTAAGNV